MMIYLLIPVLIFLLALLGLLLLCVYVQNNRLAKLINRIPGPPTIPILGNLLMFHKTLVQVHQTLLELACSYYPICRIWMFTVPVVIILHPDDIEIILASTKHIDKKYGYEHFRPWLKSGLLISTGQKWQTRRKILTPSFHFNVLQKYMDITMEQSEREIIKMRNKGKEVTEDLLPFCSNLTLNIICEAAMGVTLESEKDESAKKYKSAVYKMGTMIVYRILRPYLRDWMIPLMPKFHKEIKELIHDLDSFTINVIQERRAYHKNNNDEKLRKDLDSNDDLETSNIYFGKRRRLAMLDLLLAAENDGLLDEEGIIAEVATFIFEGHDTSAMALCFGLLLFAENKESQDLARQEVEEILSRTNGKVTTDSLLEMNYLEKCIKEMIRLYPSVPSITRSLKEDLKLKNCIIPKGSEILVHIEHVHRNPEFWPEPTKFNPDRFLKDEIKKRHPFSYVPFSGGPRNCIGQKFAMLELKSLLAHILYNFYLKPVTNTSDIKIQTDIILRPSEPVYTKFIRIDR